MAVSKDTKFRHSRSRDSQFNVWKISSIAGSKHLSLSYQIARQKLPVQLTDTDTVLEEILLQAGPTPRNKRKVHLSLKQTKILASLLPNAIININDFNQNCYDNFAGVLLFADVSGFTLLCEKYKGLGKSGSDKLTVTLNNFLGAMVEVIYKHGGDVLKFSGDALLALWKLENHEYMYSLIHRVVCCAVYIQRSMGIFETDVKVLLKVKLAISAGNMTFSVIGNENSRHYLIAGQPIFEVKAAERVCTSGEVVLSLSAWGHLSAVNYEYYWKDNEHVKIIRIIYNPENTKREILPLGTKDGALKSEFHIYNHLQKEVPRKRFGIPANNVEARALIEQVSNRELNSELKTFLIPPVVQQIDADLPVEYLSEIRNVTIMFVNIVPNRLNTKRLINMVDQAYILICSLASTATGSVNKVSLFDKDVMVLIIFGLRGFTHEGEVAASLKCGHDIWQACCTLDGVSSVSVGVTTGKAYCGVIGHPLRREYTVLGPVVNKAARIMCAYPGKVTCDQDTFMFSNLGASFFSIQEKKFLKGIEDTGPIYEFTRVKSKNTLAAMHEGMYPILARNSEILIFRKALRFINNPNVREKAILIKGNGRIGKTRLLDEIIIEAHSKEIKPIVIALHAVHSSFGYGTAQSIIKKILEIPDSASVAEKEYILSRVLKDHVPFSDYWYLNEIMNVKFPQINDINYGIDTNKKFEQIKNLFHIILREGTNCSLFVIDDIHFCDELSWKLLLSVIDKRVKFFIMTMPNRLRPATAKFLTFPTEIESHVMTISLPGLPDDALATLACQILNARAVPPEVESILIEKSRGNPGWCETFLLSLCQSNVLKVEGLPEWHIKSLGLIMPPEIYLKRRKYQTFSDGFNAVNNSENPEGTVEDQSEEVEENHLPEQSKEKQSTKSKFVQFFSSKAEKDSSNYFGKSGSFLLYPEEAYEDFKQRIDQIRKKSRDFCIQSHDEAINIDLDVSSEREIQIDEEGIKPSLANVPNRSQDLDLFSYEEFNNESDNQLSKSESSLILMKSESLNKTVSEVHRRFLPKKSTTERTFDEVISEEPIIQSLINLTKSVKSTQKKSKSVDNVMNQIKTIGIQQSIKLDKFVHYDSDGHDIQTSILWKSPTELLINESINVFVKNKAKNKQQAVSSHSVSNSSIDLLQESSVFSRHGKHSTTENRGSVIRRSTFHDVRTSEKAEEYTRSRFEIERPEEEKPRNFSSSPSVRNKKKGSIGFLKLSRSRNGSIIGKVQDKSKGWKEKLFHWGRRQSVSLESVSYLDIPIEYEENSVLMPAILINPSVKLDEIKTPEYFAEIIMTAFDCLRPYEQLMLKCGSIIGDRFTRKMLNAIMHHPNQFLMAEAVKRLFEMKILCCGRESISEKNAERQCFCTLKESDIVDNTMPTYSFCQLLMFRFASFRSTLYELMPMEQKREFHIRAVEFLENEQILCNSCQSFRSQPRNYLGPVYPVEEIKPIISSVLSYKVSSFDVKRTTKGKITKNDETSSFVLSSWLPSFQYCTCLVLEAETLGQLIDHSVAAGLKDKEIYFIMSYSYVMIILGELSEAQLQLEKIEATMKSSTENPFPNKKQRRLCIGRINLLLGHVHLELGELKKSNSYLRNAMKYVGWGAPSSNYYSFMEYILQYFIQILYQRSSRPVRFTGKYPRVQGYIATCQSLSCNILMIQNKWKQAKLVALRNLNFLRNSQNLIELCNAYSDAVDICRQSGDFKFCRKLETAAAKMCVGEFPYTTVLEVIAFGRLNSSILTARLISGHLTAASKLGEVAVKISQSISSSVIESYTISKVALVMMMIGRLSKAAGLILLLPVHNILHYILSLEFFLETGFVIDKIDVCLKAILKALHDGKMNDYNVHCRAVGTIYVWFSRIGEYEEAEYWRKKLPQIIQVPYPGDTIDHMICVMKILEGDLLILNSYTEEDGKKSGLNKKVVTTIQALRKSTKKTAIILPRLLPSNTHFTGKAVVQSESTHDQTCVHRFLHLGAYEQYRLGNLQKALKILAEAKKVSNIQGNALEKAWISHSKKVWTKTSDFDADYWITAAKRGKFMKWTESEDLFMWKNFMYSLE